MLMSLPASVLTDEDSLQVELLLCPKSILLPIQKEFLLAVHFCSRRISIIAKVLMFPSIV